MERYVTGSYFDVLIAPMPLMVPILPIHASGRFMRISGIGGEFEYEQYNEGGTNYPRYFFKSIKTQTLVMEQGTVTDGFDFFSLMMNLINLGREITFTIYINLRDHAGNSVRSWTVLGAHMTKYEGPQLDANQSELAVSRIEFIYNGAF